MLFLLKRFIRGDSSRSYAKKTPCIMNGFFCYNLYQCFSSGGTDTLYTLINKIMCQLFGNVQLSIVCIKSAPFVLFRSASAAANYLRQQDIPMRSVTTLYVSYCIYLVNLYNVHIQSSLPGSSHFIRLNVDFVYFNLAYLFPSVVLSFTFLLHWDRCLYFVC